MGDLGITTIASLAIAAVGTGFSVASNISANKRAQQNAAAMLRSTDNQIKVAENTGTLQAQQQSSDRTRRYNEVIASQTAMWATRGIQLQSGTVANIEQQSTEAYDRDISTIELNRMNRLASLALQGVDFQQLAANQVGTAYNRMVSGTATSLFNFAGNVANAGTTALRSQGSGSRGGGVGSSYPGQVPGYTPGVNPAGPGFQ